MNAARVRARARAAIKRREEEIEHDEIGRVLGDGNFRLVAAMDDIDSVAFGLEIVPEEKG
jgi:hypothetical protein